MRRCDECRLPLQAARSRFRYLACGLSNVWLDELDYLTCPLCGKVEHAIPEQRSLLRRLVEAVIFKRTLLRAEEMRFLRMQLGMTTHQLGDVLVLLPETVAAMETGFRPIGPLDDVVLRLVSAQQCLRWCYPLDRLREIDVSRSEATQVLLRLQGRRWHLVPPRSA